MDLSGCIIREIAGRRLALMPERAVLDLETGDLFVADLHVGKSTAFRTNAIPIPDGDTEADLARLGAALERSGAKRLIILGDFLHAIDSHLDRSWKDWKATRPELGVTVVRGNHDEKAGDPRPDWDVELVDDPFAHGKFVLRHEPLESEDGYVLSGHLHPAIRLRGHGPDRLRLPCFQVGLRVMVLPAFTRFSGGYSIRPEKTDRVFAIADDTVMDVTNLATRR